MSDVKMLQGDCIEKMREMSENSIDAIVSDPPYGLEFMGAEWDAPWKANWQSGGGFTKPGIGERETPWPSFSATSRFGGANPTCAKCGGRARGAKKCSCEVPEWKPIGTRRNPDNEGLPDDVTGGGMAKQMRMFQEWCEAWAIEALRLLKPGGHAIVFGGTRTYHRMACALEDAGFEIRDQIQWIYGSGFPKSLDVGKAIDKAVGRVGQDVTEIKKKLALLFDASNKSRKQIDEECGFRACNYLSYPTEEKRYDPWFCVLPSQEKWQKIKEVVGQGNPEIDAKLDEWFTEAEREIVGQQTKARKTDCGIALPTMGETEYQTWDITVPATEEAKMWQGWGTALKPAHEPIVLARKPLMTTVAANILKHGTGALNIDGCRVGDEKVNTHSRGNNTAFPKRPTETSVEESGRKVRQDLVDMSERAGRWPANIIHDGSEEVTSRLGESSRFFYCPKVSKAERNKGMAENKNSHPTVKPIALMRYLCRLVTPVSGIILDPFAGSGSTGIAAMLEGFGFIGIERDESYVKIAEARIHYFQCLGEKGLDKK